MEKVIIKTIQVTSAKRVLLFDIILPENYPALTGISVSSDLYYTNDLDPGTNISIGLLRLFMADTGDELFSQSINVSATDFKPIDKINSFPPEQIYNGQKEYIPFQTKVKTPVTLINGFYQDSVLLKGGRSYNIIIYLHFENDEP